MTAEAVRVNFFSEPDNPEIYGLNPRELDLFCHEMRKPLALAGGFFKMSNIPSISEGERIEEIDEMLGVTKGVGEFIERILTTGQKQLVKVLSLGSEAPLVKRILRKIVRDTLFPDKTQDEERDVWFRRINEAETSWDYLGIFTGLLENRLSNIVSTGRRVLQNFLLSENQRTWLSTSIDRLQQASSLSLVLGAINDPDLLRQRVEEGMIEILPAQLDRLIETAEVSTKFKGRLEIAVVNNIDSRVAVRAHEFLLPHVFANLFDNLSIHGENSAGIPHGILTIEEQGGMVAFSLKDKGKGVAPEERERIFERWQRGRAGEGAGGSGLGLWFCKMLVEAHGGKIWVESERDAQAQAEEYKGSTFIFTLPFTEIKQ